MFCFPIADGSGIEYKVVFMKLGSQSMHAKVLERIERMCAINLLTLENENAGQPLDEFLPMSVCLHTLFIYFLTRTPTVRRCSLWPSMVRPATTIVKMCVLLLNFLTNTQ